ncbi:speckle-type POZ protein isoform X2 [Parasteatoda tepidariorum]|uniref:speckle-type POZ protein isoform X2 n=1 Tax=Parasteatoda tepidariorum TaxID=114398 RepID=UPI001C71E995|nr:TD and POZ domain-containing protein 3 isoform X2 [Parasteatoda tepidariorum]
MALSGKNMDSRGFTCFWRIENFNFTPGNNFTMNSPEFKIKTLKSKWFITIADKGEFLAAFLFKVNNPMRWTVHFSLSLLKGTDWIPVLTNKAYKFKAGGDGYGAFQVLSLQTLKEDKWIYLPNGSLTISFRIWTYKSMLESTQCLMISRLENETDLCHRPIEYFSNLNPNHFAYFPPSYEFQSNKQLLGDEYHTTKEVKTQVTQTDANLDFKDADELLRFFKEKDFSFVTLRTPNRDFLVHKAVLCAKSPVFNAMFERKMKEGDSNMVDIDDIDSQTMATLVQFLHFQPLGDLKWESAVTLYYAADKYQIDLLKKECVLLLKKELSVENICDALLLADLHQDKNLMSCAQEYFCRNSKLIFISKQWKDFLCHTELVAEVLHLLSGYM